MVQYAIKAQARIIRKIADKGSCVIVGRAADYILKDYKNVVNVFIYAPMEYRIDKVMEVYGDTMEEAQTNIARSDRARANYYKEISGNTWGDRQHYDLMIDSSCGAERAAEIICEYLNK